jgi:hypothetical protein
LTTTRKVAGKALRLTLGGAPLTYHYIQGLSGMFHPEIPTPIESLGLSEEDAKALSDNDSIPLELVDVTETEAKAGSKALAEASDSAFVGIREALKHRDTPEEKDRILANADAVKAVINPDQEDAT